MTNTQKTTNEQQIKQLQAIVNQATAEEKLLSQKLAEDANTPVSFGERLSDKIATFGGSWTFISLFGSVLFGWIILNSLILVHRAFDPYPYILLNLVLSCIAAIQAPVIMMSQNRKETRDRKRAENDYLINLKAEIEIRNLHQKIDMLLAGQHQQMIDLQLKQIKLLENIEKKRA
ncbi:MAG: DUF1003 domain-containing protein [Runella slithyformis]|nr:MAG: DUF1003 domain-containing protein [Runella slithyformis]